VGSSRQHFLSYESSLSARQAKLNALMEDRPPELSRKTLAVIDKSKIYPKSGITLEAFQEWENIGLTGGRHID
jgi:hypothetical protein